MSKTIVRSLLFALVGVFAFNLHAEPAWTTTDVEPDSWTALSGNLLYGLIGTKSGTISTGYGTDSMSVLTDGNVPTVDNNATRVAFQNTGAVEWSFTTPKTLEQVRVSGCYLGGSTFTRISISAVYVKLFGSDTWTALDGSGFLDNSGRSQNVVICASLADSDTGYLAQGVVGLKVAFGANVPLASYIVEIEAVGFSEATGPVIESLDITPVKTKATLSGTIADVGTDATTCDVYLSLDGGAATKIVEGVTGSFEYQLQGLTAGTTYAYELSVSNNAPTAKGTVRSGDFTTLAADAQTASWSTRVAGPGDWTALSDNLLSGLTGTTVGTLSYLANHVTNLTDGVVLNPVADSGLCGFCNGTTIEWAFDTPKTIEKIRLSAQTAWPGKQYHRINVTKIEVKYTQDGTWETIDCPVLNFASDTAEGNVPCATLEDSEIGTLAESVFAIKFSFATDGTYAYYCAEIEAVGRVEPKPGFVLVVR